MTPTQPNRRESQSHATTQNKVLAPLSISLIGAIATTLLYLLVLYFSLPETDEAKKYPVYYLMMDPFVLTVAIPVTLFGGLLAFVLSLFTIRYADLRKAVPIIFGAVFVTIAALTPVHSLAASIGAFAVLIASMVCCRLSPIGRPPKKS